MEATKAPSIWYSRDNGQVVCDECRPLYGRIPWRRMPAAEQTTFRAELADVIKPEESLCEMCRGKARRARAATEGSR